MFFFPAGVGAALHMIDVFGRGIDPNLASESSFFWNFLNDFVIRETIITIILCAGLLFVMLSTHEEPLLYPIFFLIGFFFVGASMLFSLVVSSRCISDLSCDPNAYWLSVLLVMFLGLAGSALPVIYRLGSSILYSVLFLIAFAYCSALWLVKLAGTPPYIIASSEIFRSTLLLLLNFVLVFLPAGLNWRLLMESYATNRTGNTRQQSG